MSILTELNVAQGKRFLLGSAGGALFWCSGRPTGRLSRGAISLEGRNLDQVEPAVSAGLQVAFFDGLGDALARELKPLRGLRGGDKIRRCFGASHDELLPYVNCLYHNLP